MAGAGAGFLAGLVEGIGGSVLEGRRKKVEEEHRREEELSNLYIKSVFSGDLRPEVGFGEFSKIVSPIIFEGMSQQKGGLLGKFAKHFKEPDNLAKLMTGLHEGMGVTPPASGPMATPDAPTTEGENGNLPSRSTMVEGTRTQTPQGLAGLLVSPEERDARSAKAKAAESEAGALGADRGRMRAADELSKRYGISPDEALQRVGLKGSAETTNKPPTGPLGQAVSKYLAGEGLTWATADPDMRRVALTQAATAKPPTKLPTGAYGQRIQREFGKIGSSWEEATPEQRAAIERVVAPQMEREDTAKFNSLITKRDLDIQKDEEALRIMKDKAPLTLKTMQLGIETKELALARTKLGGPGGKGRDPSAILQGARSQARADIKELQKKDSGLWATIKDWTGFGDKIPDIDELTDKIALEISGVDANTLRAEEAARQGQGKPGAAKVFPKDANGNYVIPVK